MCNDTCSPECKTEAQPRIVTGGYWIWWCTTHNQPTAWCQQDVIKKREEILKKKIEESNIEFKKAYADAILSQKLDPITKWAKIYITTG